MPKAVFISAPLATGGDRWRRNDKQGPSRAGYSGPALISTLDVNLLLIHSTDDERYPFSDAQEVAPLCRRAELLTVHGLTHRRTARDPEVVTRIADFVTG